MNRKTVSFANQRGLRVKGILFEPDAPTASDAPPRHKTGILYLPGIVLGLTAVHRLSVQVATEFQQLGYPVFLFDHSGIGESEGDLFSGPYDEFVSFIKRGSLVDDTLEAVDYFAKCCGLREVVLIGHCGGALTAVYATEKSKKISRLLLISPPLVGESTEATGMSKAQSKEYLALYKHKLFSVSAWSRLFSGKSDYRQILRMVRAKVFRKRGGGVADDGRLNKPLLDGLASAGRRIDVKIIYGDRDPGIEEFRGWQEQFSRWRIRTTVIPNASHGFVTDESMTILMSELKAS